TVLVRSFERDSTLRWLFVYHAFGMYWLVSVLLALVDMTVAMAVAVWYFTPTDRQTKAKAFDVADPVHAARVAHGLITSHILRVGAINRIGNASVLLGKLIICSATSVIAWTMLVDKAALSDVVVPMSVIVLGSYAIAHTFMTVQSQ
ncbi:hypothetical protein DYB28_006288, partial [Aphanomyces astaci]